MKTRDIRNALNKHLGTAAIGPHDITQSWPNVEPAGGRPRMDVSFTGVSRTGDGVTGNEILEETGQFSVVIAVDQGAGEDQAADIADEISDRFPEGLSLPIANGNIVIIAPAEIRGGFPTDADYRMPVVVRYHALRN